MASRSKRKRPRLDEATRIARAILPLTQANRGGFKVVDIANRSDADQRHMVRSGEKRTIRRLTHVERLSVTQGLDQRELAALQWYADAHAARYDTLGIIGNYGEGTRCGRTDFDHLPSNIDQALAAEQFDHARSAISAPIRNMFDRVVLQGFHVGKGTERLFRLALNQLMHRIEQFVALCE
jgi:hypothetical protein